MTTPTQPHYILERGNEVNGCPRVKIFRYVGRGSQRRLKVVGVVLMKLKKDLDEWAEWLQRAAPPGDIEVRDLSERLASGWHGDGPS